MNPFKSIEDHAAAYFGISVYEIRSKDRHHEIVMVRHIIWYTLSKVLGMSYAAIGRAYGRDHTTILHGVDKVAGDSILIRKYHLFLANFGTDVGFTQAVDKTVDKVVIQKDKVGISHKNEIVIPISSPHRPQVINTDDDLINNLIPEPVRRLQE